jgi:hypothetical protein
MNALRVIRAGLAGSVAWYVGLNVIFGQAQAVLADPSLQSEKMNAIYAMNPPARIVAQPWLLLLGFGLAAFAQAVAFAAIRSSLPAGLIRRGLAFGAIAWALFTPWFEFYLPWSLMHEPTALVLIELLCWSGVMAIVGVTISFAFGGND